MNSCSYLFSEYYTPNHWNLMKIQRFPLNILYEHTFNVKECGAHSTLFNYETAKINPKPRKPCCLIRILEAICIKCFLPHIQTPSQAFLIITNLHKLVLLLLFLKVFVSRECIIIALNFFTYIKNSTMKVNQIFH